MLPGAPNRANGPCFRSRTTPAQPFFQLPQLLHAPVADTGFADSNAAVTGCFPNQLYTAVENGGRVYVTGICASPRGPAGAPAGDANNKTKIHSAVWSIDAGVTSVAGRSLASPYVFSFSTPTVKLTSLRWYRRFWRQSRRPVRLHRKSCRSPF